VGKLPGLGVGWERDIQGQKLDGRGGEIKGESVTAWGIKGRKAGIFWESGREKVFEYIASGTKLQKKRDSQGVQRGAGAPYKQRVKGVTYKRQQWAGVKKGRG